MSYDGVVHYDIIDTTRQKVNGTIFLRFLNKLIIKTPEDVMYYLDNCKFHHMEKVTATMDFHNIKYLFSSPYSPDYNPIELLFAFKGSTS